MDVIKKVEIGSSSLYQKGLSKMYSIKKVCSLGIWDGIVMMIKQVAAKNTMWHDVFRLKYAQIRPENNYWCPPAFQLKIFVKPSGDHPCSRSSQNDIIYWFPDSFKFVLRLFLNLNFKYWAYLSLDTSCDVVFFTSTCLITIMSLKIKLMANFLTSFFLF